MDVDPELTRLNKFRQELGEILLLDPNHPGFEQYVLDVCRKEIARARLRFFVWEGPGVLESYGPGIAAVLARDEEHARALLHKKYSFYENVLPGTDDSLPEELMRKPRLVTEAEAFACYGSDCGGDEEGLRREDWRHQVTGRTKREEQMERERIAREYSPHTRDDDPPT